MTTCTPVRPTQRGRILYRQLPKDDLARAIIAHAPMQSVLQFSEDRLRRALFGHEFWLARRFGLTSIDEAVACIASKVDACIVGGSLEPLRCREPGVVRVPIRARWSMVRDSFAITAKEPNASGLPDSERRLMVRIAQQLLYV